MTGPFLVTSHCDPTGLCTLEVVYTGESDAESELVLSDIHSSWAAMARLSGRVGPPW